MSNPPADRRRVLTSSIIRTGVLDALRKLDPRLQVRNPVMFVVYVASLLTTVLGVLALAGQAPDVGRPGFVLSIAAWLWLTVMFANFAEAVAEGRGKAQAAALRSTRREVQARRLASGRRSEQQERVPANSLRRGEFFLVEAGEIIPADGEVVEGVASVDESAVTGESAPVLREAGSDFSSVTGGTRVLSDWLVVRVGSDPGESFLDRMIAMVEGARRGKTPN
ncbi:MAG: potassium-transporting ATPase ATP-binding subunit, partial [Pseudomonadota bacterium]|nr:potassium-transporting ATPase ATP-binding subunit [Pseudomonadota bacterium]